MPATQQFREVETTSLLGKDWVLFRRKTTTGLLHRQPARQRRRCRRGNRPCAAYRDACGVVRDAHVIRSIAGYVLAGMHRFSVGLSLLCIALARKHTAFNMSIARKAAA